MSNSEKNLDDLPELPDFLQDHGLWQERPEVIVLSGDSLPEQLIGISLASLGLSGLLEIDGQSVGREQHLEAMSHRRVNGPPPPYVSNKRPSKRRQRRAKGRANPQ